MSTIKRLFTICCLLLMIGAVLAPSASALSRSERECNDAGGTFYRSGSTVECVYPEQQVANPNANPNNNSQTTQETTQSQGNLTNTNKKTYQEQCTGPGGSGDNSAHCR